MNKKSRKSLNDALADQFVYGRESGTVKGVGGSLALGHREDARTDEKSQPTKADQEVNSEIPSPTVEVAKPATSTKAKNKESSLMDKLQVEAKESTTRLTVDLPLSMHRRLSILAAKTGRKKVEIVRMLLDEALPDLED
jgi:hypothetical protein